jgi:RNA polymerase sigma factor (sigma-70 family)
MLGVTPGRAPGRHACTPRTIRCTQEPASEPKLTATGRLFDVAVISDHGRVDTWTGRNYLSPLHRPSFLARQSDARLVELARDGNQRAFETLVNRYRRQLVAASRRFLPPDLADDALQNGLLAAWMALQRGTVVAEVKPWLETIVRNAGLRALPNNAVAELPETLPTTRDVDGAVSQRHDVRAVFAALATMPAVQREALLQTSVGGRSYENVASRLGITEGALRGLVHRARVQARAAVGALIPWPLFRFFSRGARGASSGSSAAQAGGALGPAGFGALASKGVIALATLVIATGTVVGVKLISSAGTHAPRLEAHAPRVVTARKIVLTASDRRRARQHASRRHAARRASHKMSAQRHAGHANHAFQSARRAAANSSASSTGRGQAPTGAQDNSEGARHTSSSGRSSQISPAGTSPGSATGTGSGAAGGGGGSSGSQASTGSAGGSSGSQPSGGGGGGGTNGSGAGVQTGSGGGSRPPGSSGGAASSGNGAVSGGSSGAGGGGTGGGAQNGSSGQGQPSQGQSGQGQSGQGQSGQGQSGQGQSGQGQSGQGQSGQGQSGQGQSGQGQSGQGQSSQQQSSQGQSTQGQSTQRQSSQGQQ